MELIMINLIVFLLKVPGENYLPVKSKIRSGFPPINHVFFWTYCLTESHEGHAANGGVHQIIY